MRTGGSLRTAVLSATLIALGFNNAQAQSTACQPVSFSECQGSSLVVQYTAIGSFNAGNIFACYLSDEVGSFAAPVLIGQVQATTSGQIICTIPMVTLPGTGYRVRVDASDPATQGNANASDIEVIDSPYAGPDEFFAVCSNGAAFALITLLPDADINGVWMDPNWDPTSGLFFPGVSLPGCYTYIVAGVAPCPADTSVLCVDVPVAPNAGIAQFATLCSNSDTIVMFDYLGGTPDLGGYWYGPNGNFHSGFFIPGVDPAGCYTYTVGGASPCPDDSSTLCIFVNQAPDAGTDTTIYVCDTDPPLLLFDFLGGTPQPGGAWAFNGAPHGPIFQPGVDSEGCYAYTVLGVAPCPDTTAVLCIVDSCLSVGLYPQGTTPMEMWISSGWNTDHPVVTVSCASSALLELIDASGRTLSRRLLRTSPHDPQAVRLDLALHGRGLYTLVLQHGVSRSVLRLLNE